MKSSLRFGWFHLCLLLGLGSVGLHAATPGTVPAKLYNGCGTNITIKVQVGTCHSGIFVNVPPGGYFDFVANDNNDCGTALNLCSGPYRILQGMGLDGWTFANGQVLQYGGSWGGGVKTICGNPNTTNFFTVRIRNNSNVTRTYQIFDQYGNPIPGARGATWISIGPGATDQLQFATTLLGNEWSLESWAGGSMLTAWGGGNFTYTPGDTSANVLNNWNGDGAFTTTVNNGGSTFPPAGTPGMYFPPPAIVYSNPASWGSNQPVAFAPGSDLTNTLQTGFSALYSALNSGFGALDADERAVKNSVDALAGHIDNLTNSLRGGSSSNYVGDTSWTNGVAGSKYTDGNAAWGASETALGSAVGNLDEAIGLAGGVGGVGDHAGGQTTWDIEAGAGNPHFHIALLSDPNFASLWPVIRTVWCWLLAAAYLVKVIKDLHEMFTHLAISRGANIQNFDVLGTNVFGWGVVVLVIVAVLLVYALALAAGFAGLTGNLSWSALFGLMSSDPLTGAPSGGLAILAACFPTSLFFGLIAAYVTFRLTVAKVAVIAMGAVKFVIGS
jgi:hypothetical protein